MPDSFDEDRALVTLTLPDEKRFEDGHWGLMILSVDAEGHAQRFNGLVEGKGEYEGQLEKFRGKTWKQVIDQIEREIFFKGAIRFLFTNGNGKVDWKDFRYH